MLSAIYTHTGSIDNARNLDFGRRDARLALHIKCFACMNDFATYADLELTSLFTVMSEASCGFLLLEHSSHCICSHSKTNYLPSQ